MNVINPEKQSERQDLFQPESDHVIVSESHVSFGGVKLERATNRSGSRVIRPEAYQDFIDDSFSLQLQQDIATSFSLSQPMLIEGGTSLGKTTTVKRMASLLGWEVFSINFTQQTDVDDFMGRYVVNPKFGLEPNQPEYIFQLGEISQALVSEEGKTKVLLLDEYNAASGGVIIKLHEILDQYSRGGSVMLPNGDIVTLDKSKLKIVACMNPPANGYQNRNALDPAQMRRWNYFNLGEELPEEIFTSRLFETFTLEDETAKPFSGVRERRVNALEDKEFSEIPKLKELLIKYRDFHIAVKSELKKGNLAGDQAQEFTYDDQELPKKIKKYISEFYNGNINETIQTAIYFYYVAPLSNQDDRKKVIELAKKVSVKIDVDSRRVSINPLDITEAQSPFMTETETETDVELTPTIKVNSKEKVKVVDTTLKSQPVIEFKPYLSILTQSMPSEDPYDVGMSKVFVEDHMWYEEVYRSSKIMLEEKIGNILEDIYSSKFGINELCILLKELRDKGDKVNFIISILLRIPKKMFSDRLIRATITESFKYLETQILVYDYNPVLSRCLEALTEKDRKEVYDGVNFTPGNFELFLAGLENGTSIEILEEIFKNFGLKHPEYIIKYIDKFVNKFPEDITEDHKKIVLSCLINAKIKSMGYSHLQRLLLMNFGKKDLDPFSAKFLNYNIAYSQLTTAL